MTNYLKYLEWKVGSLYTPADLLGVSTTTTWILSQVFPQQMLMPYFQEIRPRRVPCRWQNLPLHCRIGVVKNKLYHSAYLLG